MVKTWPENTDQNKIKWASMGNRPPQFRTLTGTIGEVKKFFSNNQNLSLPQICKEVSKLVDILLCSGSRSKWENGEYAEEVIKKIKSEGGDFPLSIFFIKKHRQFWVVDNYVRKFAPVFAEELLKLSPTFNLSYLISYASYAFHYRVGNCMEHAFLTQTLLLYGGKDFFKKNDIYCASFVISKKDNTNHAQVLLVRGKRFAEIIKNYFLAIGFNKDAWKNLLEINYQKLKNYNEAKNEKNLGKGKKAAEAYYEWLRGIDENVVEKIYRSLRNENEENAYIADGFWGIAEHPRERINNPVTLNFISAPLFKWGRVPDLMVLFCNILYDYKEFLLSL